MEEGTDQEDGEDVREDCADLEESEDDNGMTWESMKYSEGGELLESPQSKIFKRPYYVGRSTVGAARRARQTAGQDDKFLLTETLLREFHDHLQSTTGAVTNTNNMASYKNFASFHFFI
jgi:hypothetical protein